MATCEALERRHFIGGLLQHRRPHNGTAQVGVADKNELCTRSLQSGDHHGQFGLGHFSSVFDDDIPENRGYYNVTPVGFLVLAGSSDQLKRYVREMILRYTCFDEMRSDRRGADDQVVVHHDA